MKAAETPMTFIVFLIIIIIVFVLILIWHFSGFGIFREQIGTVTCGLVNNTSKGGIQSGCV